MSKPITLNKSINGFLYAEGYTGVKVVPENQELSWHIFKEILNLVDKKYSQITVIGGMYALKGTKGVLLTTSNSVLKEPAHIIYAKVNPNYDGAVPEVTIGENITEKSNRLMPLSNFQDITKPAESLTNAILHNIQIEEGLYLSDIVYNKEDFSEKLIFNMLKHRRDKATSLKLMPGHIATRNSNVEHPTLQNTLFIYTNLDKYAGLEYTIGNISELPSASQFETARKGELTDTVTIFSDQKLGLKGK